MQHTNYTVGFTDDNTIQLRFELGAIAEGAQTTDVPAGINPDEEGFVYDNGWVGRVTGPNGEYFQYYDTYLPSDIDDLFDIDTSNTNAGAMVDDLSSWTVRVNGEVVSLTGISRKSNILETAETSLFSFEFRTVQNVFLQLDHDLAPGDEVTISFDDPDFSAIATTFDPSTTISEAVHVNLVGYDPDDVVKKAFLSSWNGWSIEGDGTDVPEEYAPGMTFDVVDAASGAVVYSGDVVMAQALEDPNNFWNNFNRTDVWEMDFSALADAGDYYVAVDGVGISQTFTITDAHWQDIFETSFSGFYHQRSGIALEDEYTDFVRPASLLPSDTLEVLRTTVRISETSEGSALGGGDKPFDRFPNETTGETVDAWGGWHDAGDWDRRTQHLEASRNLVELLEMQPDWADNDGLSVPEQGDGIPDILQEAMWGAEVFMRLQTADGGIPGGIEQPSYETFGGASWTASGVIYAYAPDVWSSWEYAATAAKISHSLKNYDASAASEWLASAEAAMAYAESNWQIELGALAPRDVVSRNIAGLEMYRATGDASYHDIFVESSAYATGDASGVAWNEHQFESAFLYAQMGDMVLNETILDTGLSDIQGEVDLLLDLGQRSAFGNLYNPYAPYGWGNTAPAPNHSQDVMVRLHHLTGDDTLLEVIQNDVQYALGANPLNMTYMTGLGDVRGPEELLNLDAESLGYGAIPGITVYGDRNIHDYGPDFYDDIMYADAWPNIWQAPVSESWQGFSVYVPVTEYTVQQGVVDMTYVTGYLAALESDGAGEPPVEPEPATAMQAGTVRIQQQSQDYWQRVDFDTAIEGAVVVMGPGSAEGSHPFSVRVRNVDETGFEFQIDEWSYLDGSHAELSIDWIAGSAGSHTLDDGTQIQFGTATANGPVALSGFDETPTLFGQLAGMADGTPLTHRILNVESDGFSFITQTEEALWGQSYSDPALNFVAVLDGSEGGVLDIGTMRASHRWTAISDEIDPAGLLFADMQSMLGSNTATLRYRENVDGARDLRVLEEQSANEETRHLREDIGVMSISEVFLLL